MIIKSMVWCDYMTEMTEMISRMTVSIIFTVGLSFGAGVGVLNILAGVFGKKLEKNRIPAAVGYGYVAYFGLSILLTALYLGSIGRVEGSYPEGAMQLVWAWWFGGAIAIPFLSLRYLLRFTDGCEIRSWQALILSVAMLPGFLVAMLFAAIAGQGP